MDQPRDVPYGTVAQARKDRRASPHGVGPARSRRLPTETHTSTAEVTFDTPRQVALILDTKDRRQQFYASGDVIQDRAGTAALKIVRVENGRMHIAARRGRAASWIPTGRSLPGLPAKTLAGTPLVRRVPFPRHHRPGQSRPACPRGQTGHAVMRIEVPPPQATAHAAGPDFEFRQRRRATHQVPCKPIARCCKRCGSRPPGRTRTRSGPGSRGGSRGPRATAGRELAACHA
jgi:hypothetical protein